MKRGTAKRLLTACLTLGAATALAATAQAQDTTQTGAAPMPEDTAPTGQPPGDTLGGDSTRVGYPVDTTAPPGYQGVERPRNDSLPADTGAAADTSDSAAAADTGAAADTSDSGAAAAPSGYGDSAGGAADSAHDTSAVGDENARQPEEPVHPDSSSESSAPQ